MKFIEFLKFHFFVVVARAAIITTQKTGIILTLYFLSKHISFQIEQNLPNKCPMSRSLFNYCMGKGKHDGIGYFT